MNKTTSNHIIIKLKKTGYKYKILNISREKVAYIQRYKNKNNKDVSKKLYKVEYNEAISLKY